MTKLFEVEQSVGDKFQKEEFLINIAKTALSSKAVVWNKEEFAQLVVRYEVN
jgi:hypothetical protein